MWEVAESGITDFKDLIAWKKGMELAQAVYELTASYPIEERYGLVAQTRRASVSVPCNIAEGFGRSGQADFLRFLDHSVGSANEVETQLLLAVRLGLVGPAEAARAIELAREEQRILKGLIGGIRGASKAAIRTPVG